MNPHEFVDPIVPLAKRFVANKCWRWVRGMSNTRGEIVFDGVAADDEPPFLMRWVGHRGLTDFVPSNDENVPELDPSTLACIECVLLPEVWAPAGDLVTIEVSPADEYNRGTHGYVPIVCIQVLVWTGERWRVLWTGEAPTRAEALLACLEAAA